MIPPPNFKIPRRGAKRDILKRKIVLKKKRVRFRNTERGYLGVRKDYDPFYDFSDLKVREKDTILVRKSMDIYFKNNEYESKYSKSIGEFGCCKCRKIRYYATLIGCVQCQKNYACEGCLLRRKGVKKGNEFYCSKECREKKRMKEKSANSMKIFRVYQNKVKEEEEDGGIEKLERFKLDNPHLRHVSVCVPKKGFNHHDREFHEDEGFVGNEIEEYGLAPPKTIYAYYRNRATSQLLSLLEFLTESLEAKYNEKDVRVIIVGEFLGGYELFPKLFAGEGVEFRVYDPSYKAWRSKDGRLRVMNSSFENYDVVSGEKKSLSANEEVLLYFGEPDSKPIRYDEQQKICSLLNPTHVMFRFIGKLEGSLVGIKGKIFISAYQEFEAGITAVLVKNYSGRKKEQMRLDRRKYMSSMKYFEDIRRGTFFKLEKEVKALPAGIDYCWDCMSLLFVVESFLFKFRYDPKSRDEIMTCIFKNLSPD